MALAGLDPCRLKAILVSHEHRDHVLGVGVAARVWKLPVYVNEATLTATAGQLGRIEHQYFETNSDLRLGALDIHAFSESHDAADTVGFTFRHNGRKLGVATDLGVATHLVREHLAGCQALVLEANHDPDMLMDGPYPWHLKSRVHGREGHLSNHDSAELLAELAHPDLGQVVLAHLSEVNNTPELALECVGSALTTPPRGFQLIAASQRVPGPVIKV